MTYCKYCQREEHFSAYCDPVPKPEPTIEQRKHSIGLAHIFSEQMIIKYKKGQEEHGGNLWEKPNLLDNAIDEVVDLAIYLLTLRDQVDLKNEKEAFKEQKPYQEDIMDSYWDTIEEWTPEDVPE
jgi:hypothetical protein